MGGEVAEDFEAGDDVEAAVEPAAVGDGVEVATDEECFFGLAGKSDPVVGGCVVVVFDGEIVQFAREPFACFLPGVGPGYSLGSLVVAGEGEEFFEFVDGALGVEGHVRSGWVLV